MTFNRPDETIRAFEALERAILNQQPAPAAAPRPPQSLRELALLHGADKGDNCASYEMFITGLWDQPINILEIGIGGYHTDPSSGGGSLRMWRDYFPRAQVFGIDLFDKSPHVDSRIHIYRGSQDDAPFLQKVAGEIGEIDVIIDDGSHFSAHVITSFETLFPYLKSRGVYIVEDIATSYWPDRGGSRDIDDPLTSMNYFKSLADGLQWPHSQGVVPPHPIAERLEFLLFAQNFIVMRKL